MSVSRRSRSILQKRLNILMRRSVFQFPACRVTRVRLNFLDIRARSPILNRSRGIPPVHHAFPIAQCSTCASHLPGHAVPHLRISLSSSRTALPVRLAFVIAHCSTCASHFSHRAMIYLCISHFLSRNAQPESLKIKVSREC